MTRTINGLGQLLTIRISLCSTVSLTSMQTRLARNFLVYQNLRVKEIHLRSMVNVLGMDFVHCLWTLGPRWKSRDRLRCPAPIIRSTLTSWLAMLEEIRRLLRRYFWKLLSPLYALLLRREHVTHIFCRGNQPFLSFNYRRWMWRPLIYTSSCSTYSRYVSISPWHMDRARMCNTHRPSIFLLIKIARLTS